MSFIATEKIQTPVQTLKPTPQVPYLPNTSSLDEITAAIARSGGVVIKNAVSTESLDDIEWVTVDAASCLIIP